MATVAQIAAELRRRGVTVHEWPGCEGRGNEGVAYIDAKGGIVHHTGSNYGSAYAGLFRSTRPDLLGGLLCNFAGNEDGSLTVMGTGMAWHAAPATGPSLGALAPYGKSLNRNTVGLEIVYPGSSPMRDAQYRTALVWAKTVADLCAGGNLEAIRAHAEASPSGKWDPGFAPGRTIDMAAFRRDAAAYEGDDMTPEQDKILRDILYHITPGQAGVKNAGILFSAVASLSGQVSGLQAALSAVAAAPAAAVDLDAVFEAAQEGARSIVDNLRVVADPGA